MNAKRISLVFVAACLCGFAAPYAAVSEAAQAPAQQAAVEDDEGTSAFHELIFERNTSDIIEASGHKFVVTPKTVFLDRHGVKTSLSSIKRGSILRVRYRQESDSAQRIAVKVEVRQGPGE